MSVTADAGPPPASPDDSQGFADVERDYVRRFLPDFDWLRLEVPSPRVKPAVPLHRARIALVSTAGAHTCGTDPMPRAGEIRRLPRDAVIELTHVGYDTRRASADRDVVYPLRVLEAMADEGMVGSVAPWVVSTMGFIPDGDAVLERLAPQAAEWLREDGADLALLVPA
jgi:hypothetical protein